MKRGMQRFFNIEKVSAFDNLCMVTSNVCYFSVVGTRNRSSSDLYECSAALGSNSTLNDIGCASANCVNASSSMGCLGSFLMLNVHSTRAALRKTDLGRGQGVVSKGRRKYS